MGSNEIEALFNSVDSLSDDRAIKEISNTRKRGPSLPNRLQRGRTLVPKRFLASSSQEPLTRGRTLGVLPSQRTTWKAGASNYSKEGPGKSIGAAVKDILARRQKGLFKVTQDALDSGTGISGVGSYNRKPTDMDAVSWHSSTAQSSKTSLRFMPSSDRAKEASCHQARRPICDVNKLGSTNFDGHKGSQNTHIARGCSSESIDEGFGNPQRFGCDSSNSKEAACDDDPSPHSADSASSHSGTSTVSSGGCSLAAYPPPLPLPAARWDWKSLLIAWSSPLDQILTALRAVSRTL